VGGLHASQPTTATASGAVGSAGGCGEPRDGQALSALADELELSEPDDEPEADVDSELDDDVSEPDDELAEELEEPLDELA
jgi:hypothetical protein